jgi:hypothetical protein
LVLEGIDVGAALEILVGLIEGSALGF